jgi:hypothetical protein
VRLARGALTCFPFALTMSYENGYFIVTSVVDRANQVINRNLLVVINAHTFVA